MSIEEKSEFFVMEKHYSEEYFYAEKKGGKRYTDSAGKIAEFGYRGGGVWNFQAFLDKLIDILSLPESILDLGAGCGGFVATANTNGIKSIGLEFSQYAIDHAILDAEPYLKRWDITQTPWPIEEQYDWTTCIDLMEHLFKEDVDAVITEMKRVTKQYIIAKICTAQLPREVWNAEKASYEQVYAQAKREGFEWLIASGHVTCQFPEWWLNKFVDDEWINRADLAERFKKDLQLPEDWRTTLVLEHVSRTKKEVASPFPATFTSEYYDENYFVTPKGKKFRTSPTALNAWSYSNPTGEYLGCKSIVKAWKTIFNPTKMLDVACGRGTFLCYARDIGIDAVGFDFSEYGVKHPYPRCKSEWIKLHDATKPWPYLDQSFDFVTVLDFLEHVYTDDLPFVISELYRVASKWIFIQTAVPSVGEHGVDKNGYILKKGEQIPLEREKFSVAGHVTLVNEVQWEEWLDNPNWMRRRDLETYFKALVPKEDIKNWLANSIMIWERL